MAKQSQSPKQPRAKKSDFDLKIEAALKSGIPVLFVNREAEDWRLSEIGAKAQWGDQFEKVENPNKSES